MFLEFSEQFRKMAAHFESTVDAETPYGDRLAVASDAHKAVIDEVGTDRTFVIFLLTQNLQQDAFFRRMPLGEQTVNEIMLKLLQRSGFTLR